MAKISAQISTVLWDTGGVLLTNGWDHNERRAVFQQFHIEDRDVFEQRHEDANDLWEKGEIDFEQYLQRALFFRPRPFTPAEFRKAVEDQSALLDDSAFPVLDELHARGGLRMGQLNNESRELNDLRLARFRLDRYWEFFFCSAYVHLRKPDPAFFRLALEVLQVPAAEVVFIDDREKNVEAAASHGIHGIQYTGSAALRSTLVEMGLLEPARTPAQA